ncbi:hypothetical protein [Burkholderia phage BCSR5]|nr:hypothetical protein [Burkholderia phage BCSR5]
MALRDDISPFGFNMPTAEELRKVSISQTGPMMCAMMKEVRDALQAAAAAGEYSTIVTLKGTHAALGDQVEEIRRILCFDPYLYTAAVVGHGNDFVNLSVSWSK